MICKETQLYLQSLLKQNTNLMETATGKKWHNQAVDASLILRMMQIHSVSETIANLLVKRNIDIEQVPNFLLPKLKTSIPDPFQLLDMRKAVNRVLDAVYQKQKIVILGDYDVDGATSAALLKRFFAMLNVQVNTYIPDRIKEGYGPNINIISRFKEQNYDLVIIVDSGTVAFEPLNYAKTIDLDVIVVDHHISDSNLPEVIAIINPNRLDECNPHLQNLAAVGISFLLAIAVSRSIKSEYKTSINLLQLLDLVALGTVCDVMKIQGLNRCFVSQGLKVLNKKTNLGIKTMCEYNNIQEEITAYHLGFVIGPRINAGGRIGDSHLGTQLLSTNDTATAMNIVQQLEEYNMERKLSEEQVKIEAIDMYENNSDPDLIMVSSCGWHVGVIGIVASRLKEKYNLPVIIIALDENNIGKASCRSIDNVDIGTIIGEAKKQNIILEGGGHKMAGGFSIKKDNIELLREFIKNKILHSVRAYKSNLVTYVDTEITIAAINEQLLHDIDTLAPFGVGNTTPNFLVSKCRILKYKIIAEKHIQCILADRYNASKTIRAIAFNCLDNNIGHFIANSKIVSVLGQLKRNYWANKMEINIHIEDIGRHNNLD